MSCRPFCLLFILSYACYGQNPIAVYRPWGENQMTSYARWDSVRESLSSPTADGNRPVLPGVTGRNLELLQDAVARKQPNVTHGGSLTVARKVLAGTTDSSFQKLRGTMAEALFLDGHEEWGYVSKPNASQHDVYAKMQDGGPGVRTGQVKFHISGDPATYARDMVKDNVSGSFFVPDDHVDELRAYLKKEADRLRASGDNAEAAKLYRDRNRVKGIGATSTKIDNATRQAISEARVIRVAPYVYVGVATVLLVAPAAWDWYQGDIDGREAAYRLTRGGSAMASAIVADQALKQWKGGLLRGTLRGNVIVATVALIVDTSWEVYEYGGVANASQNPDFIIHLGGSISATACGLAGGYVGMIGGGKVGGLIGAFLGPEAVPVCIFIGGAAGGILVGSGAGIAGYFGGSKGTRWVMETYCPEKLYEQEHAYVQNLQKGIEDSITSLQRL